MHWEVGEVSWDNRNGPRWGMISRAVPDGGWGGGTPLSLPGGQEHDLEKRCTVKWVELQMWFYLELSVYTDTNQERLRKKGVAKSSYWNWRAVRKSWKNSNQYSWEKQKHTSDRVRVDSHSKGSGGRRWAKRQEGICLIQGTRARLQWLWLWRVAASWWTSWASPGNSVPFCNPVGVNAIHDFRGQGDDSPVKNQEKGPFICQVLCSGADLGFCEGGPGSGDGHFHTEVPVLVPSSCSLVGSPWVGHFTLWTSISQSIKYRDLTRLVCIEL